MRGKGRETGKEEKQTEGPRSFVNKIATASQGNTAGFSSQGSPPGRPPRSTTFKDKTLGRKGLDEPSLVSSSPLVFYWS